MPVYKDDSPELSGFLTEHWDDSVDATVVNPTITVVANFSAVHDPETEKRIVMAANKELGR